MRFSDFPHARRLIDDNVTYRKLANHSSDRQACVYNNSSDTLPPKDSFSEFKAL